MSLYSRSTVALLLAPGAGGGLGLFEHCKGIQSMGMSGDTNLGDDLFRTDVRELPGYTVDAPEQSIKGRNSIPEAFGGGVTWVTDQVVDIGISLGRRDERQVSP